MSGAFHVSFLNGDFETRMTCGFWCVEGVEMRCGSRTTGTRGNGLFSASSRE